MTVYAFIGAKALYLLFVWLISAVAASWLTERKGYGERLGLAFGLILLSDRAAARAAAAGAPRVEVDGGGAAAEAQAPSRLRLRRDYGVHEQALKCWRPGG